MSTKYYLLNFINELEYNCDTIFNNSIIVLDLIQDYILYRLGFPNNYNSYTIIDKLKKTKYHCCGDIYNMYESEIYNNNSDTEKLLKKYILGGGKIYNLINEKHILKYKKYITQRFYCVSKKESLLQIYFYCIAKNIHKHLSINDINELNEEFPNLLYYNYELTQHKEKLENNYYENKKNSKYEEEDVIEMPKYDLTKCKKEAIIVVRNTKSYDLLSNLSKIVNIDDVLNNIDIKWHLDDLSFNNKNISLFDILNNPSIKWDYSRINYIESLTPEIVNKYKHISWNYDILSYNKNFTIDYIMSHKNYKWNWNIVFKNKSITGKTIIENYNKMDYDKSLFSDDVYNKILSVNYNPPDHIKSDIIKYMRKIPIKFLFYINNNDRLKIIYEDRIHYYHNEIILTNIIRKWRSYTKKKINYHFLKHKELYLGVIFNINIRYIDIQRGIRKNMIIQ